jgi:hypothetical protein
MNEGPTIVIDRSEATSLFPYRVAPKFSPTDISKPAYLNRVVPLVERGEMPASVIALADTAVPVWALERAGFGGDEILKSEARARLRGRALVTDDEIVKGDRDHEGRELEKSLAELRDAVDDLGDQLDDDD